MFCPILLLSINWFCLSSVTCSLSPPNVHDRGMLYPRESESRQLQSLDGMWNFRADRSTSRHQGLDEQWFLHPLAEIGPVIPMPVPSSFNDITTDRTLQNFVGWVWYDRTFYICKEWNRKRVVLRIGSAHYNAIVWVNGHEVVTHSGGHLPFEAVINNVTLWGLENRVTIAVNNTLTPHTLPPGSITFHTNDTGYPPGYFFQNTQFDFFNYAGLHRQVLLYTTPRKFVDDITVVTNFKDTTGVVSYSIVTKVPSLSNHIDQPDADEHYFVNSDVDDKTILVEIIDRNGTVVANSTSARGQLSIDNVKLWWPYTMDEHNYGYLYTLKVTFADDVYRLPFGVRDISVSDSQIFINKKPFYCHGVAKHEDSDIRGKGLDLPLIARDFNMLKWLGANCFRTSHYPYAEEIIDQADQQGIVVIDECPGVGIKEDKNFGNKSLAHHLAVMTELIRRDKNHPSVVLWSVANEPSSAKAIAEPYFKAVINHTRFLDPYRLVTFACNELPAKDRVVKYVDVIGVNRYYGWYQDNGELQTIPYKLRHDLTEWYNLYRRPVIITEYGADAVPGLHTMPSFVFTEEFQVDFMREYHFVFDEFRKSFLAGEMVWNFADFMTAQSTIRVVGNKKGLLTRQRQPKMAAHLIRHRYWSIINETLPAVDIPN